MVLPYLLMPPKKKCTHKARKAELVFLERPQEGPIHCYETPRPSAENPRCVPTKPIDQNTCAAWLSSCTGKAYPTCSLKPGSHIPKVCPQFETTTSVVLEACQKQHRGPHKPQNKGANHSLLQAGESCQKAIACKFPPLTFENPEGFAVHSSDHPNCSRKKTRCSHSQPKKRAVEKASSQVNSLENCREILSLLAPQPMESEVFSPPDVETPQVPSIRNWSTLSQSSSCTWHPEKELTFGTDPCGRAESAAVLVPDTLEHEYGVKVTWRRRPHVMKYLREKGKLSAADILVKANPKLSRRQANI